MLVSDTPDVENINVLYLPTSFVPGFGICLVCWNPFQSGFFGERWQKVGQKSRNLDPNSTFFGLKMPGPGRHISVGMMCRCTLRCVSKCIHHLWPNGAPWRPILRLAAPRFWGILQLAGWLISMGKSIYKWMITRGSLILGSHQMGMELEVEFPSRMGWWTTWKVTTMIQLPWWQVCGICHRYRNQPLQWWPPEGFALIGVDSTVLHREAGVFLRKDTWSRSVGTKTSIEWYRL